MKKKEIDTRGLVRTRYVLPEMEIVNIDSQAMLCESGNAERFDGREDVTDDWFNE